MSLITSVDDVPSFGDASLWFWTIENLHRGEFRRTDSQLVPHANAIMSCLLHQEWHFSSLQFSLASRTFGVRYKLSQGNVEKIIRAVSRV